jgi:hypothetical protein
MLTIPLLDDQEGAGGEDFSAMPKHRNRPHHHPHDYNQEDKLSWPTRWGRTGFIYPKGYILPKFMRREEPYNLPVPPLWGVVLFFALVLVLIAVLAQIGR